MELLSEETKTLLIALLLDSFDDVRDLAMNVLQMIMHDEGGHAAEKLEHGTANPLGNDQNRLVQILEIAEKRAAQSGRADHADGVARVHALLFALAIPMPLSTNSSWYLSQQTILQHLFDRCDQMLISLRANLSAAIHGLPFHATLISLRYVVDQIQVVDASSTTLQRGYTLATKVQETVVTVWEIVRPVLCDDAPEGYMPAEAEDSDLDLDTKDILSFSWRALKEVSLLQRALVINLTKSPGDPVLDEDKFLSHLNLCFTQLRDLRHRGAFSTVAQTFTISCMQYMRCFSSGEKSLRSFYENTITSINSLSTINTRRSAGLPAMLAGLLASTSDSSPLFSEAIGDLTKIASGPIVTENTDHQALPQVHALNCLREVFKHSRLGQRSEKYIPEALQLSGICLTSDLWGIRNSGLMLFRALIDRLLGASDANDEDAVITRSKDVLSRYSQTLELIFTLLDANLDNVVQTSAVEKVFPALQLLQRVSPPPTELSRLRIAVYSLTGCPHWLVRDKAARAMARLYQREEVLPALIDLAKEYKRRHNAEHGRLLTIKYLLRTLPLQDPEIRSAASEIVLNLCSGGLLTYGSDIIEATTLDVITEYVQRVPTQEAAVEVLTSMSDSNSVAHILEMRNNDALAQIPHSPVLVMALASLLPYDQESYSETERITTLAKTDPDACVAMLEGFEAVVSRPNSSPHVVNSIFQIVMGILRLASQTIPRVLIAAMDVVHSCALTGRLVNPANIDELSAMWFDKAMECGTTPLSQDRALIVSGIILDMGLQGVVNTSSELSQRLGFWLLQIRDAAEEDQPFDTRFAAATALEKVQQGLPFLRYDDNFANMVVDYAILVYDLTNDDDDEVRGVAAKVACRLFSSEVNHVKRLVPLAAGSQMLSQLVRQHVSSTYLAFVAVSRLISSSHHNRTSETVMDLLRTQTTEENVLFAEEKQNLFIDPAREARVWSKLLMSLAPDAIGRSEMQNLQNWTIEGLIALDDTANALAGGPLGWSYKPDSFALGLRVIYSAQTLLYWQRTRDSLRLRSTELRDRLGQLLRIGQRCGLNVIWLEELEKILARDLFLGVQKVGRILRSATTGSA
ncbi:hypothetical protein C1H76_4738 [Elsinoe australis]|uniref:Uncharacterized protein n=1 Tax=Elsinoe australis TaxID=40998 RepID=A0A4U7AXI7_9PEZI|nr:hypothetical protein C1H76_4738 [Elsinoe australis]